MEKIEKHIKQIKSSGFTVLKSNFSTNYIEKINKALDQIKREEVNAVYPGFTKKRPNDKQLFNLQNKNSFFIKVLCNSTITDIVGHFLDDPYYTAIEKPNHNFILGEYIARCSGERLPLHIDSWMPNSGDYPWMMQVAILLNDRNISDGCTTIVPGTHNSNRFADRDFPDAVNLEGKAGDVLIWDSRTWHGANENNSKSESWALIATFQKWWVKQRFDLPAALPSYIWDSLNVDEKILLGFASRPPLDESYQTDMRGGIDRLVRDFNSKDV